MLNDKEPATRMDAASALGKLGTLSSDAITALGTTLKDRDHRVVQAALASLATQGKAARDAVPVISNLLQHPEVATRVAAIEALGKMQPEPDQAIPLLSKALKDDDWSVRKASALALGPFGAKAKSAVPALFELLHNEVDRDAARDALRQIDTVGPEAIPVLIKSLESEESRVRFYAVFFLGKLGPEAKEALPALQKLKREDSSRLRRSLEETIKKIEGEK